jgi:hypothetical protein
MPLQNNGVLGFTVGYPTVRSYYPLTNEWTGGLLSEKGPKTKQKAAKRTLDAVREHGYLPELVKEVLKSPEVVDRLNKERNIGKKEGAKQQSKEELDRQKQNIDGTSAGLGSRSGAQTRRRISGQLETEEEMNERLRQKGYQPKKVKGFNTNKDLTTKKVPKSAKGDDVWALIQELVPDRSTDFLESAKFNRQAIALLLCLRLQEKNPEAAKSWSHSSRGHYLISYICEMEGYSLVAFVKHKPRKGLFKSSLGVVAYFSPSEQMKHRISKSKQITGTKFSDQEILNHIEDVYLGDFDEDEIQRNPRYNKL